VLPDIGDPIPTFVAVFAALLGVATLVLLVKYVRETASGTPSR